MANAQVLRQNFVYVVNHVCNNWTALQLCLEHGMGGPNSHQMVEQMKDYVVDLCCSRNNVSVEEIEDALTDILDEEFDTLCEDNSPKEISLILFRFLSLLKEGKVDEFNVEIQKLPVRSGARNQMMGQMDDSSSSDEDIADDVEMDESDEDSPVEDGWTKVKTRKNKR